MKDKRIVVCLKYYKGEMNPFDGAALECALETGAKEIIALSMAPMAALDSFQSLTRLGVKCVLVSDIVYAGSDTQATSLILAEALKRLAPDLIFCGRQSVDGDTAQVPPMLAQRLGYHIKAKAISLDGERITLRSGESFFPETGTVITFEKIRTLRFPSIFSKMGEVQIWDNKTLCLPIEKCGIKGSPTRVINCYESNVGRRICKFSSVEDLPLLIKEGLEKKRVERAQTNEQKLDEVFFVGDIEEIAMRIAKKTTRIEVEKKTPEKIAEELRKKNVKTLLWEDNDELKILAPRVAVLTGAGICADCISFCVKEEKLIMTRPAQGDNITADIICLSNMAFATVRTAKKKGAELVFAVGKGAINKIEEIGLLAKKYGADLCCSRIVADSGKMPYEAQVGLTGKSVSPKVYVAFGISGAVQHTCAIEGAGTVIAVNTDKNARIFDYADYGIIAEVKNVEL